MRCAQARCKCHGRHEAIRDFLCQACKRKVSARRDASLYRLKAPSKRIAQALHAIAKGLSTRAAARVVSTSETTLRRWLTSAGQHSTNLPERFLRALHLSQVQLDEIRLKLYGLAEAKWLWIACDARTKLIPAYALGTRTQEFAHQLVHNVAKRLAPGCLPVFSSDGLALYFYAITAHFGAWMSAADERHRTWCVAPRLLYAQVVKRYRRHRITEVRRHVLLGQPEAFRQALTSHGFSGRVQTAFIERLNLTVRRSLASLARRSWSTAHSTQDLALQFDWWRAIYHFVKPHHSLRQKIESPTSRSRYRSRTPAQAAGLTRRRWSVLELLNSPAPPCAAG